MHERDKTATADQIIKHRFRPHYDSGLDSFFICLHGFAIYRNDQNEVTCLQYLPEDVATLNVALRNASAQIVDCVEAYFFERIEKDSPATASGIPAVASAEPAASRDTLVKSSV